MCNIVWLHMCAVTMETRLHLQLSSHRHLFVSTGVESRGRVLPTCNAAFKHTEVLHHHIPLLHTSTHHTV